MGTWGTWELGNLFKGIPILGAIRVSKRWLYLHEGTIRRASGVCPSRGRVAWANLHQTERDNLGHNDSASFYFVNVYIDRRLQCSV